MNITMKQLRLVEIDAKNPTALRCLADDGMSLGQIGIFFERYGSVTKLETVSGIHGRSTGLITVRFSLQEEAERAVEDCNKPIDFHEEEAVDEARALTPPRTETHHHNPFASDCIRSRPKSPAFSRSPDKSESRPATSSSRYDSPEGCGEPGMRVVEDEEGRRVQINNLVCFNIHFNSLVMPSATQSSSTLASLPVMGEHDDFTLSVPVPSSVSSTVSTSHSSAPPRTISPAVNEKPFVKIPTLDNGVGILSDFSCGGSSSDSELEPEKTICKLRKLMDMQRMVQKRLHHYLSHITHCFAQDYRAEINH